MRLRYRRPSGIEDLQPLIAALRDDLGPEFERSMRAWCGLEPRPYQLDTWEIFIAWEEASARDVGIFGYYRHPDDVPGRFWIGWLGVVPEARRKGVGAQLLNVLAREVARSGAKELWVYTEPDNHPAIEFYRANGMDPRGLFADLGLPQAAASARSMVFAKALA